MKKFLVVVDKGWSPGDQHITQLHKLCHDLNTCGVKAYITQKRSNPLLNTPFLNELEDNIDCEGFKLNKKINSNFFKDYYVIFPEYITPAIFDNKTIYNVYAFQYLTKKADCLNVDTFAELKRNKKILPFRLTRYSRLIPVLNGKFHHHLLSLPIQYIDFNTFRDFNKPRKGQAFIQKRGLMKVYKHNEDAIFLDPYLHDWSLTSQILNSVETLYCYDMRSVWPAIAALCGCNVIMVPNLLDRRENIPPEKYREFCDLYKYGIAFNDSESELLHAKNTLTEVYANTYSICHAESLYNARRLILHCDAAFN